MLLIFNILQREQETMMLYLRQPGLGSCGVIIQGRLGEVDGSWWWSQFRGHNNASFTLSDIMVIVMKMQRLYLNI